MEPEKKGKRYKRSPPSDEEKLSRRLKREGVEVEMQEARPKRKAAEGVSYTGKKPITDRRMVAVRRAARLKAFPENVPSLQPLPELVRVPLPAEYYRPRPTVSSALTTSNKSSKKSSNGSYQRVQQSPEDTLIQKLEEIDIGEYEFKDLPKLKRNQKFTDKYNELLQKLKEKVIAPVKKIKSEEILINNLYITMSTNLKQWLETLQRNNINRTILKRLKNIVDELSDVGLRLPEIYDSIKYRFERLFTIEDNQINTLLLKNTQKRVEHTAVIDEGAKHKYYSDYYTKRLEDIYTMKEMFVKHKNDVMKLIEEYGSSIYEAFELITHANEFVEKYDKAIQEYEASKKQEKGDLDDLISMFGNL